MSATSRMLVSTALFGTLACGAGGLGSAPTVSSGTAIATTAMSTISSETKKAGDEVEVRVAKDVSSPDGKSVLIPAGSTVTLTIDAIAMAPERGEKGTLAMSAKSITINGKSYPIDAKATSYTYDMKARGVNAGEVATTGAGAVVGGVIGHALGGGTGTVVGAVGGGAAGAAIAAKNADRDIIVAKGNSVTLTLKDPLVIK